jgi:tetratricopeptide (TPR) repeat protein
MIRLAAVFAVWLACLCACQADPAVTFDSANELYEQGKFTEAAAAYEQILAGGRASAAVYFNLGNACFKAGQIGRAICAYREAKAIAPRDPDVIANLQFARNQVQGPTVSSSLADRWLSKFSVNEWTLFTCGTAWLWLLALILSQWRPSLKPALRGWSIALAIATVLIGACLGSEYYRLHLHPTAVVVANNAVVHQAPLAESPGPVTLHDGAEVRVLDRKGEWLQVTTDARRIGWVVRAELSIGQNEKAK